MIFSQTAESVPKIFQEKDKISLNHFSFRKYFLKLLVH